MIMLYTFGHPSVNLVLAFHRITSRSTTMLKDSIQSDSKKTVLLLICLSHDWLSKIDSGNAEKVAKFTLCKKKCIIFVFS